MGQELCRLIAERDDCAVVAGVDRLQSVASPKSVVPLFPTLAEVSVEADVLIDFSHPEATLAALPICGQKKLPCVICTTGLTEDTLAIMRDIAQQVPVFHSANMSLGINLLLQLAKQAAALLPGFDIEIVEKHHHNKLDAPSGTALMLANAINEEMQQAYHYQYNRQPLRQKRPADEIGIHSVRGGSIVGEHEVIFAGPDEVITLSHSAASRAVFANGAIAAALFVQGRPAGCYSMEDLLNSK